MTSFKKNCLIIIPTYNEKNNIYFILNKISKYIKFKHDILFVDDNSYDGTLDLIKNINSKKIFLLK
jgi:glycosyltransferase involved in cell wall biosynthesis